MTNKMNSQTLGSDQTRFDFLRYLLPAIIIFIIIIAYGQQLVEIGRQFISYESDSDEELSESDDESEDESLVGQIKRGTRRTVKHES